MEAGNLSIGLAFLAGFVSFISPCVLPLVPAYVGYMGGRATNEAGKDNRQKFSTFIHGVFFVLGFTSFFVGFGLLTSAASSFLNDLGVDIPTLLIRLGGIAVIFFGLYVMHALDPIFNYLLRLTEAWKDNPIPAFFFTIAVAVVFYGYLFWAFGGSLTADFSTWEAQSPVIWASILFLGILALFRKPLNEATSLGDFWNRAISSLQLALLSDTRKIAAGGENHGYGASYGLGLVFSAGWTPCIGPVYAAVLALAADASTGGSLLNAAVLLTAYSMGLGVPFLLTALAFNQSTALMTRLKRNMRKVELASGALLLLIGVLIMSGGLTDLSARFAEDGDVADFSFRLEECTAGAYEGRIDLSTYPGCLSDGVDKLGDLYIVSAKSERSDAPYVFAPAPEDADEGLLVGDIAPNFTLITLEGETVSLEDYRGQAVLINFWATWCGPCRREMPDFNAVYGTERDRGFVVLAINQEESAEQAQGFVDEFGVTFPVLLDEDGDVSQLYQVRGLPTSYLIDGNGIIQNFHPGLLTAADLYEDLSQFDPEANNGYVFDPAPADAEVGVQEGDIAPNFTLTTLDGETVSLEDYRGQAVLINFWATWCGPCRREMPDFNAVYGTERDRGFVVLAINQEESAEQAQGFADEFGVTFPVLLDEDGDVSQLYQVRGLPTSYLIDGNGVVVSAHAGILTAADLYEDLSQFEPADEADTALRAE